MPQQTINELLKLIDSSVNDFVDKVSPVQEQTYRRLLSLVKELKTDSNDNIKNSLENIEQITKIKNELDRILISPQYKSAVKDFALTYHAIADLQNEYFAKLNVDFSPKKVFEEVKKVNIKITVDNLTGIGSAYTKAVTDILQRNITTGGSYADFTDQIRLAVLGSEKNNVDGTLLKYARQIATDAVNQYNASYNSIVTSDLGLEWFQYTGSLLTTSRDFCKCMVEKRYFHISEVPDLLAGIVGLCDVPINDKTGLPYGFIAGTNEATFFINRGGWQCGHQIFPTLAAGVPKEIRDSILK